MDTPCQFALEKLPKLIEKILLFRGSFIGKIVEYKSGGRSW
jgi:hypothetical protein